MLIKIKEVDMGNSKVHLKVNSKEKTLVDKILKLVFVQDIFYNHIIDKCVYFVYDDELYGYTTIQANSIDKGMYVFWKDECNFHIIPDDNGTNILEKSKTTDFLYLGYDELVDLYSRLNLDYNIQSNKDALERPNENEND